MRAEQIGGSGNADESGDIDCGEEAGVSEDGHENHCGRS